MKLPALNPDGVPSTAEISVTKVGGGRVTGAAMVLLCNPGSVGECFVLAGSVDLTVWMALVVFAAVMVLLVIVVILEVTSGWSVAFVDFWVVLVTVMVFAVVELLTVEGIIWTEGA